MTTETESTSFLKGIGMVFGAGLLLMGIYAAINIYLIRTVDASTNLIYDGFGRQLELIPPLIRIIFKTDSLWPEFMWSALDTVVLFSTWALGYFLVTRDH